MRITVISGGKKFKVSLTTYLASELNRLTRIEKDVHDIKQSLNMTFDNVKDSDSSGADNSSQSSETKFKPGYFVLP